MIRLILILTGVAGLAYAALGLLTDPDVRLGGVLLFLVVVLVAHDGLWMPLVLAVGALTRGRARVALLIAAAVAVVGVPLVAGPLPGPYARNLAIVLAAIGATTAVTMTVRKKSESRRRERRTPADR